MRKQRKRTKTTKIYGKAWLCDFILCDFINVYEREQFLFCIGIKLNDLKS